METSYWQAWARRRFSRRRVLRAFGAVGLLTAGSACTSSPPAPAAVPTTGATALGTAAPRPPSAALPSVGPAALQPKRGGAFRWGNPNNYPHLDPHLTTASAIFGLAVGVCYSRLLKFKLE